MGEVDRLRWRYKGGTLNFRNRVIMRTAEQVMRTKKSRKIMGWEEETIHPILVHTHKACRPREEASRHY